LSKLRHPQCELNEMLVMDLLPKQGIIVHDFTLYYWLQRGIQLNKITEVMEYSTAPFVENYMNNILQLRKQAANKKDEIGVSQAPMSKAPGSCTHEIEYTILKT